MLLQAHILVDLCMQDPFYRKFSESNNYKDLDINYVA